MRALKHQYILLTMAIGLLAACSREGDELDADKTGGPVPLSIAASIGEPITRAAETSWAADDQIGVFVTQRGVTTLFTDANGLLAQNLKYTFNDGTNYETNGNIYRLFAPSRKIYLSSDPVDVYGYYPYRAQDSNSDGIDDLPPASIPIDISDQTRQEKIDFMRAKKSNVDNGNATIELLFQHRLVKLVFNLRQGDDLLPDELNDVSFLGMTIAGQPVAATYNIYTDLFIITAGNNEIVPVRASSAPTGFVRTFEALVLPNGANNPAQDRTVTISFYRKSKDTIVNTFKIPAGTYFTSGYKYTYNVTVNATSIQVDPTKYTEQW